MKGANQMNIKQNIEKLLEITTNYKISKATGIAETTLGRYTSGNSKIGNMKLDHAITLNDYYIKNKEMFRMENTINEIRKKYMVDGESEGKERYADLFTSKEDITEVNEIDKDIFESKYNVSIDELSYPIITFDYSGSGDGVLFESGADKEDILEEANDYFIAK